MLYLGYDQKINCICQYSGKTSTLLSNDERLNNMAVPDNLKMFKNFYDGAFYKVTGRYDPSTQTVLLDDIERLAE